MDPDTDATRLGNDRCTFMPRVLWWDLGDHGTTPSQPLRIDLSIVRERSLPSRALDGIDLAVAEAHDIRREETRRCIAHTLKTPRRPPILFLTEANPDNMRFLNELSVEGLAWTFEPEEEVLGRGLRLVRIPERIRVAEHLIQTCSDRALAESVMEKLFVDLTPPSRVNDLAKSCFMSRRTLEKRWKAAWPRTAPISLKALVDWALVLRARDLGKAGVRPDQVAKAFGIHKRTLERTVFRAVGLTCRKWVGLRHREVLQRVAVRFKSDREDGRVLPQE